jgi:hypothetical protein
LVFICQEAGRWGRQNGSWNHQKENLTVAGKGLLRGRGGSIFNKSYWNKIHEMRGRSIITDNMYINTLINVLIDVGRDQ